MATARKHAIAYRQSGKINTNSRNGKNESIDFRRSDRKGQNGVSYWMMGQPFCQILFSELLCRRNNGK
jgi:hypothetical protein